MMMMIMMLMAIPVSSLICSLSCCLSLLSCLTMLIYIPAALGHNWSSQQNYHGYQGDQPSTHTSNHEETSRDIGSNITQILNSFFDSGYDKRVRPNYGGPPVKVGVTMHILTISSVSEVQMDFTADFYFRQIWRDPRLSFKARPGISQILVGAEVAEKIWVPDTFFANEKQAYFHEATTKNTFLRISHDGQVLRSIRLTVTASCPMNLQYFPMDRQKCNIEIESYGYSMTDIIYNWVDENAVKIDSNLMLPQFSIASKRQSWKYVNLSTGNYSRLMCEIQLTRSMGYYMIQIYVPASLIVIISWVSFWLHRNATPARVHLGVITVLTMTTLMSSTNSQLPKISYVKSIDVFLGTCFVMVFAALLEYAAVGYIGKRISMRKNRFQQLAKAAEEKRRKLVEAAAAAAAAAAAGACSSSAGSEALHPHPSSASASAVQDQSGLLSGHQQINCNNNTNIHNNQNQINNNNNATNNNINNINNNSNNNANNNQNNNINNNYVNDNNNTNNNNNNNANTGTSTQALSTTASATVAAANASSTGVASTASSFHQQSTGQQPVHVDGSALHSGSGLLTGTNVVCSANINVGLTSSSVPKQQQQQLLYQPHHQHHSHLHRSQYQHQHQHLQHQHQHHQQHQHQQFQHQQSIGNLTSALGGGLSVPSGLVTYDTSSGGIGHLSGGSGNLMMGPGPPGMMSDLATINCPIGGGHGGSMGSVPFGCLRDQDPDHDQTLVTHVGHYATLRRPLLDRGSGSCKGVASSGGGGGSSGGGLGIGPGPPLGPGQKQFFSHRPQEVRLEMVGSKMTPVAQTSGSSMDGTNLHHHHHHHQPGGGGLSASSLGRIPGHFTTNLHRFTAVPPKNLNNLFGVSPSDIDKYSRVVFPVCFVCFNLMYWIIFLHISSILEPGADESES